MQTRPFKHGDPVASITINGKGETEIMLIDGRINDSYWCPKKQDWICLVTHKHGRRERPLKKIKLTK